MRKTVFSLIFILAFLVSSFLFAGILQIHSFEINAKTVLMNSKPSDYDYGKSFFDAIEGDKPALVMFYTDWCGYCKRAAPVFAAMRSEFEGKANFVMVHAEEEENLANEYGVTGYPTILYFSPGKKPYRLGNEVYDEKEFRDKINELLK